jgi:hypothetical protein
MTDRSLLIQDRKLVPSGISMGRVGVFSDGLEAEECLSNNVIRNRPLLDSVSVSVLLFHWCSVYIRRLCFLAHLSRIFICLEQ